MPPADFSRVARMQRQSIDQLLVLLGDGGVGRGFRQQRQILFLRHEVRQTARTQIPTPRKGAHRLFVVEVF